MRIPNSLAVVFAFAGIAAAQVLSPAEIADPSLRELQQAHLDELHAITAAIAKHEFPYRFSFSRKLDLSEKDQARNDQRAIQFDKFQGQTVLKITGNYFAAYSAERMTGEERIRRTYQDVMLPILEASASALAHADVPDAFALEISHHVIRTVMGQRTEIAENAVLILPKAAAMRLLDAKDEAARIATAQDGVAYLNGSPISIFPSERKDPPVVRVAAVVAPPAAAVKPAVEPAIPAPHAPPSGTKLEDVYRDAIARMTKDLDSQAHFVAYAPPEFVPFRGGKYLELPMSAALSAGDSGSQYKLAALAFDRHVGHLIRPVLAYFKDSADFAGFNFSTTVRVAGEGDASESVEFILPLAALRRYALYNLTGQQLLDAGVVLINGERAGLDLQVAEAQSTPRK
jgi:hypothetical protein